MSYTNAPILVLIRAADCVPCQKLSPLWPAVEKEIQQALPNVLFVEITIPSLGRLFNDFNTKLYPKDLQRCVYSFPTLIMIPSTVWHIANRYLGPDNPAPLLGFCRAFNVEYADNNMPKLQSYEIVVDNRKQLKQQIMTSGLNIFNASQVVDWAQKQLTQKYFHNPNLLELDAKIIEYKRLHGLTIDIHQNPLLQKIDSDDEDDTFSSLPTDIFTTASGGPRIFLR